MTREQREALEALVDATTLSQVISVLAGIAYDKAEHLESNWQDPRSARDWTNAGVKLAAVAAKIKV